MNEQESAKREERTQRVEKHFSEVNEFNHERNEVAKAQKQMSSQETAGVLSDAEGSGL